MNATHALRDAGQSIWLDTISKSLLRTGRLAGYIDNLNVTGVTSNPTILQNAIVAGNDYDDALRHHAATCCTQPEHLVYALALDDLVAAADLLAGIHDSSGETDGFVSVEVPPSLVDDTQGTVEAGLDLFAQADRPNVMIKVPGTPAGLLAFEELIVRGVPVNVTLLFAPEHWSATAEAYQRALERRRDAELPLTVASVASVFVSRWDVAADPALPHPLRGTVGIATCQRTYAAHLELLASDRWQQLSRSGATAQKVLWASTSSKDPARPDTYYVDRLAGRGTVNTIPEPTLVAFADHGQVLAPLGADPSEADAVLAAAGAAGLELGQVASQLQRDAARSFQASWDALLADVATKMTRLNLA